MYNMVFLTALVFVESGTGYKHFAPSGAGAFAWIAAASISLWGFLLRSSDSDQ